MGYPEVLQKLLVGGGLLQRVELDPVDVLQKRVAQHRIVCSAPYDRRDAVQSSQLRRPPPPLTHDQLVAGRAQLPDRRLTRQVPDRRLTRQVPDRRLTRQVPDRRLSRQVPDRRLSRQWANHDGLQQPEFPDRMRELSQRILIEYLPGLPRVRHNGRHRHLLVNRPGDLTSHGIPGAVGAQPRRWITRDADRSGGDQRRQPATEPAFTRYGRCRLVRKCAAGRHQRDTSRSAGRPSAPRVWLGTPWSW